MWWMRRPLNSLNKILSVGLLALLACNANSPETKFILAEKLLEDKKYDASISEFQSIVDKSPHSDMGLSAQLKIAEIQHLYLGRAQEAISAYHEYLKRSRDENKKREVEKILADLQFQAFENYDEAIATYTKLVKNYKNEEEAEDLLFRLGRAFFLKSQFTDAEKVFRYMKETFPNGKAYWKAELEVGNTLSAQGKWQEAIKVFDRVIEHAPREQKALAGFGKASSYEEQDDLDKAYEIFASVRDDYPAPSVVDLKMQKIKRRKILRRR